VAVRYICILRDHHHLCITGFLLSAEGSVLTSGSVQLYLSYFPLHSAICLTMPTIAVDKAALFRELGREYVIL
jgi:hypothetical protein